MNGKLGAIYIGNQQVGGFLDWHQKLNLTDGVQDGDATHKVQSWRIIAWAHWLMRVIEPDAIVKIRLCADEGPAYWEGTGRIASKMTATMGTLTHLQFEVIGSGELEGKKVQDEE